jgi:quercetin dioxygenase-like cupin family protein
MNVCELPADGVPPVTLTESRVMRFQPASGPGLPSAWQGVPVTAYKAPADHHCGVSRAVLAGASGERTAFHVRYFEIGPGGYSTLERHEHEHVVVVLRGQGEVRLGASVQSLGYGDAVYVAPNEVHQLRNPSGEEPFGFLCIVDARRDSPVDVAPAL